MTKYLTEVRKIENTINNFVLINLKTQMKWKKLQKKKKDEPISQPNNIDSYV